MASPRASLTRLPLLLGLLLAAGCSHFAWQKPRSVPTARSSGCARQCASAHDSCGASPAGAASDRSFPGDSLCDVEYQNCMVRCPSSGAELE